MSLKFGTDGIRGRAYDELTVRDIEALARAAARVLGTTAVAIGTDTRESGPDFVAALGRGFSSEGAEAWFLGEVPTPVVAHTAARHQVVGAMVSASHNPYYDNGVKLFAPGGHKLSDSQQAALEEELARAEVGGDPSRSVPDVLSPRRDELVEEYRSDVEASIESRTLNGIDVVVDCANGAASGIGPDLLRRLGATVTTLHDRPTGRNINDGAGSTSLAALQAAVVAGKAHMGIAFDGDADRVLAVDEDGQVVDGDQIIAVCAIDMLRRGVLADDTVVVTVMTNLGFHHGMAHRGVHVHETQVGDRYVLEALEANGWSLGGEQSGHVIFRDMATTGDGILTAVQLLDTVIRADGSLRELAGSAMTRLPQQLRNVEISGDPTAAMDAIASDISRVAASLEGVGRVLVRPSGTEPLIRFMAEAPTQQQADAAVGQLIEALNRSG
ncbi:MAG: phosphoglucosamine mutase [Acidimicrobiales bacterium]